MKALHGIIPAFLAACLLLGGASAAGFAANLVLQLVALPIIGWGLWRLSFERPSGPERAVLMIAAALVVLMLVQLIPLPPALWSHLPGRGPVASGYALLGVPLPWLSLSLAPDQSLYSVLWLLPAFAVLLGMIALRAFRGSWLAWSIVIVTAASVLLGALQVVGGARSGAYIYAFTNVGQAVGFFANSNHTATLLLVTIPFVAALQRQLVMRSRSRRNASAVRVLTTAAYVVIAVGLLTNFSLAGLGLSVPVAIMSYLAFRKGGRRINRIWVGLAIALSLAAMATVVIGPFHNNLVGTQSQYGELSRQTSFRLSLKAAVQYLPFGSGIGSFQPVYHTQEPLASVTTTYMNHAHSDWIEIVLETGLIGVALAVIFLVWWAFRVRALLHEDRPDYYARAAAIATATMMLHSCVDYPLRTAALSAVFAACTALLAGSRPAVPRSAQRGSARHLGV